MTRTPKELKLILVDPKIVELDAFKQFPHTIRVVTEPKQAASALKEACREMDRRYAYMGQKNCRNIVQFYNKHPQLKEELPLILIIIDELADLMTTSKSEVEPSILRIVQKARAAGIHLITATQRPSVDIVTGVIKANLPSRVVFALNSSADYRTVLDNGIQTELMGKGDGIANITKERGYLRFQSPSVGIDENDREQAIEKIRIFWDDWIRQNDGAQKVNTAPEPIYMSKIVEKYQESSKNEQIGRAHV